MFDIAVRRYIFLEKKNMEEGYFLSLANLVWAKIEHSTIKVCMYDTSITKEIQYFPSGK